MDRQEILEKAFLKAKRNGWEQSFWYQWSDNAWEDYADNDEHLMWIFKHDFAKAFWPNSAGITQYNEGNEGLGFLVYGAWGGVCDDCGQKFKGKEEIEKIRFGHEGCPIGHEIWQTHLEEMVLRDDPLKYLEEWIN